MTARAKNNILLTGEYYLVEQIYHATVAQLDRVLDYESRGHRFDPCRLRHLYFSKITTLWLRKLHLLKQYCSLIQQKVCR